MEKYPTIYETTSPQELEQRGHPSEQLELGPDAMLEIADALAEIEQEFGEAFEQLAGKLVENDTTAPEASANLQEKYNLPFDPDKTIRGIGSVTLMTVVVAPEALQHQLKTETVRAMAGEKNATDEAEDAPEEEANFDAYLPEARVVINKLYMGDESALSGLPEDFQEALKARMKWNKNQIEDGTMSEGEMQEEIEKMYSVASIGLAKTEHGEQYGAA
jgi:hypothetical protein